MAGDAILGEHGHLRSGGNFSPERLFQLGTIQLGTVQLGTIQLGTTETVLRPREVPKATVPSVRAKSE